MLSNSLHCKLTFIDKFILHGLPESEMYFTHCLRELEPVRLHTSFV